MKNTPETVAQEILDVVPFAMRVIREEMRRHRGSDLSIPQFRTLLFLQRNPDSPLKNVAEHLGLTPPTVSKMISVLVSRGLLDRPDSTIDRRRVELKPTVKGNALVDRVRRETAVKFAQRLEEIPSAEREKLSAALDSLRNVMRTREKIHSGGRKDDARP
jgi:DNA-binding MarR family transcriptional regulator